MNPALIISLIEAIRLAISTARELGLDFGKVASQVAAKEATGQPFTIADAHVFVTDARSALDKLEADIKAAQAAAAADKPAA